MSAARTAVFNILNTPRESRGLHQRFCPIVGQSQRSSHHNSVEDAWVRRPTARVQVRRPERGPFQSAAEGASDLYFLVIRQHGCPCGFLGHPRKECSGTPRRNSRLHEALSRAIFSCSFIER